jgi:hypothetical protein
VKALHRTRQDAKHQARGEQAVRLSKPSHPSKPAGYRRTLAVVVAAAAMTMLGAGQALADSGPSVIERGPIGTPLPCPLVNGWQPSCGFGS